MTVTFKTVAKLAIGAIATVAAVHVVNKTIGNHYKTDAAKIAAEAALVVFAMTGAAFRWFQRGMAYGATAGAGYAIGNNLSMDELIDAIEDKKARCIFINNIQNGVRF